jgi:excisionase family DNA binding protein
MSVVCDAPLTISVGRTRRRNMELIREIREAFSVREFCAIYGICRQTFYDEIHRGRLKAVKLGAKTIVLKADADGWAASLPVIELSTTS